MARKISDNSQYFVRQCRMFGDSPKPLPPDEVRVLVRELLDFICTPLASDGDISLDEILSLADPLYSGKDSDQLPTPAGRTPRRPTVSVR